MVTEKILTWILNLLPTLTLGEQTFDFVDAISGSLAIVNHYVPVNLVGHLFPIYIVVLGTVIFASVLLQLL